MCTTRSLTLGRDCTGHAVSQEISLGHLEQVGLSLQSVRAAEALSLLYIWDGSVGAQYRLAAAGMAGRMQRKCSMPEMLSVTSFHVSRRAKLLAAPV